MKKIRIEKDNIYKGNLILVNKDHRIKEPICYEKLENVGIGDIKLEKCARSKLKEALDVINNKDEITFVSGYRTLSEQIELYKNSVIENGEEFTKKYVALPDCSEHQTGLAIDLALNNCDIDFICPLFPYEGICQKFREEAARWGFIERYKEDKEKITGISKEPWHFRYVGYPHSEIIEKNSFALEEYIEHLKEYKNAPLFFEGRDSSYEIYYIDSLGEFEICDDYNYDISGNNENGVILTLWKK